LASSSGGGCDEGDSTEQGTDQRPDEDDWALPDWVQPTANTGLFHETAAPEVHLQLPVVDLTWRQLKPTRGSFSSSQRGAIYEDETPSWDEALTENPAPFWMRIWLSGDGWVPDWVLEDCPHLTTVGVGYMGTAHYPIWDACMWARALEVYREVLVDRGLREDARLAFVYVPGAFEYCEFDLDIVVSAIETHGHTFDVFDTWVHAALADLATLMGPHAHKLVYTGEDYPFGPEGETRDDPYAREAVELGMGIRTGITELFDFHLSHVPAYGTTIPSTGPLAGHMVTDEDWVAFDGQRVLGTENECFNECGYHTNQPYYALKMATLKALQLHHASRVPLGAALCVA
jgi:hypothetical protein